LYVQSVDRAGNTSPLASYRFFVGNAPVTSPAVGAISAGTTILQGAVDRPMPAPVQIEYRGA
jgi:hypothetical protein